MLRARIIAGLIGGLLAFPANAQDDAVMQRFTQSMAHLYKTSIMCQDTLSPSPSYYAEVISSYLRVDYMQNYYWVLPIVQQRITDENTCLYHLQKAILNYRIASDDFRVGYPSLPTPPMVIVVNAATFSIPGYTTPTLPPVAPPPRKPVKRGDQKFQN